MCVWKMRLGWVGVCGGGGWEVEDVCVGILLRGCWVVCGCVCVVHVGVWCVCVSVYAGGYTFLFLTVKSLIKIGFGSLKTEWMHITASLARSGEPF